MDNFIGRKLCYHKTSYILGRDDGEPWGYLLVTQTTVVTMQAITTNQIPVWEQIIPTDEFGPLILNMTSSIDLPTTVLTIIPTPPSGTTQPPITTTITPPPYPWFQTTRDFTLNTNSTTWTRGPPKSTCTSGCGSRCSTFCYGPCLSCHPFGVQTNNGGPQAPSQYLNRQLNAGFVVAGYTVCQLEACEYQWEIFSVNSATPTFPGCSTDGALYSSVVTTPPQQTGPIPRLGPFPTNGRSDCYFDKGIDCGVYGGFSFSCSGCDKVGVGIVACDLQEPVSCEADGRESYQAAAYCFW